MQVATGNQLIDQKPSHDRLARAGIVGQEKAERLPGRRRFVYRGDLVRQWLDDRRMYGEGPVEQISEPNTPGLG